MNLRVVLLRNADYKSAVVLLFKTGLISSFISLLLPHFT